MKDQEYQRLKNSKFFHLILKYSKKNLAKLRLIQSFHKWSLYLLILNYRVVPLFFH